MTAATNTQRVLAVAAAAAATPRKRPGRKLPAGALTVRERRFVDALLAGAKTLGEAWTVATGTRGNAAFVGGSLALKRPEVAAALVNEARRLRAMGALRGMQRLVRLVDGAASEYVQLDAAKYLASAEGLGPRHDTKPPSNTAINISIDLSSGSNGAQPVQPIDITPQDTEPQR